MKLGKLPARHTLRTMRTAVIMSKILDELGTPPEASNNYMAAVKSMPCPMYANDTVGDCVEADTAFSLIVRTANASTSTIIPSTDEVLKLYEVFGYNPASGVDPGTDELSMCQYLKNTGFLGHRLNDYASLNPSNINHLKWCIHLFGGVRMGWQLPSSAEQQFNDNQPWDVASDPTIAGGHDTRLCHYEGNTFFTTTWARWMQPVTVAFISRFCEEAHPELAYDWIREQGVSPSGFSLNDLDQKLQEASA